MATFGPLVTLQFDDFQVVNCLAVDGESEQRLHGLPAAFSCCTRVQGQELVALVVLYLQYMAMPANEQVNWIFAPQALLEPRYEPRIILARVTADVRHQYVYFLYTEAIELRQAVSDFAAIDIAEHRTGGAELTQGAKHLCRAYIAAMPDLVAAREVLEHPLVEQAVRIAY